MTLPPPPPCNFEVARLPTGLLLTAGNKTNSCAIYWKHGLAAETAPIYSF